VHRHDPDQILPPLPRTKVPALALGEARDPCSTPARALALVAVKSCAAPTQTQLRRQVRSLTGVPRSWPVFIVLGAALLLVECGSGGREAAPVAPARPPPAPSALAGCVRCTDSNLRNIEWPASLLTSRRTANRSPPVRLGAPVHTRGVAGPIEPTIAHQIHFSAFRQRVRRTDRVDGA
jgi:hypothetical protein